MAILSAFEVRILLKLASRASMAASLLHAWSKMPSQAGASVRVLTAAAGLSNGNEHGVREVLQVLEALGAVSSRHADYIASEALRYSMPTLAIALSAVDHFSETIHVDETQAEIVLTKPSCSSSLEQRQDDRGWKASAIEATHQAFLYIVQGARERVVIMTPFLDVYEAGWLQELVDQIQPGVSKTVILRSLQDCSRSDYPNGYASIGGWLAERNVSVCNYSIPREHGMKRETFHAKVTSADRRAAYVGSANLALASRDYSMEMCVVLRGKAAQVIAEVVDAVLLCAEQVFWVPAGHMETRDGA